MLQPRLLKVEPVKPMKLRLFCESGEVKLFDVAPYATGTWYGQLKDEGAISMRCSCCRAVLASSGRRDRILRRTNCAKTVLK